MRRSKLGDAVKNYKVPWPVSLLAVGCTLGGVLLGYFLAKPSTRKPAHPVRAVPASVPRGDYRAKGPPEMPEQLRGLYPDLMKAALTDLLYEPDPAAVVARKDGLDWPDRAVTMIGLRRLDNLQSCVEDVLLKHVPGDFIEAGVWRGGATIFMKAILKEYGDTTRTVWVADSFEGLPPPDPDKYPADKGNQLSQEAVLAVSLEEVRSNFDRFGVLDERVKFLKGWFKDTLSKAPIEKLAILRLDGDLYQSAMDTLVPLYPKLSPGGYCIIDDSGPPVKQAVDDYRRQHGITEEIHRADATGAYWQKAK
jgi:O-methyltransferase